MRTQQELVRINFFDVKRCGWYKSGEDSPAFGSIEGVLSELQTWSQGVDLSMTKMADAGGKNNKDPVYLLGIKKRGHNWVFATWNEVPSDEAGVATVAIDSKVGVPKVSMNKVDPNSIPGFATYFWVLPQKGLIATIRFGRPHTGQTPMVAYLGRFMSSYMSYAIPGTNFLGQPAIVGYTDLNDGVAKKVKPMLKTMAYRKTGPRDHILANAGKIRKVVRRGHVTVLNKVDRDWWQSAMQFLRSAGEPDVATVRRSAYVELEYQPSLDDLKGMIAAEEADPDVSGWDDMGFVLQGDPGKTHWLGREQATGDFDLQVNRIDGETVELDALLLELERKQVQILTVLD